MFAGVGGVKETALGWLPLVRAAPFPGGVDRTLSGPLAARTLPVVETRSSSPVGEALSPAGCPYSWGCFPRAVLHAKRQGATLGRLAPTT